MPVGLNELLPDPISEANERVVVELVKRKMKTAAAVGVRLLHAMEARFGPEAREVVRALLQTPPPPVRTEAGDAAAALQGFCADLERGCIGTHQWERVIDEPERIGYRFTHCLWAEVYRELGEPELGSLICASDAPAARAHHPQLGLHRTQTLMGGATLCNHVFFVESPAHADSAGEQEGSRRDAPPFSGHERASA